MLRAIHDKLLALEAGVSQLQDRVWKQEDARTNTSASPKDLKNEKIGDILEIDESPEEDEFDEDEADEDELDEDEVDEDESDEYWEGLD